MCDKSDIGDGILTLAGKVSCSRVRIYNLIRQVGRGETTADNALHQLVEDYHELGVVIDNMFVLADNLKKSLCAEDGDDKKRES